MTAAALLKRFGSNEPAPDFQAFVLDKASHDAVTFVTSRHWPGAKVADGGLREAVDALRDRASPDLLLVDVSQCEDPRADIHSLADVCEPGTVVIALGEINDVALFRDLISIGVADYLVKPLTAEILHKALLSASRAPEETTSEEGNGRLCAVIGARGGVGATTVAVNISWLLAHPLEKRVALVDLDLQFGTVALALDLEAGRGLHEALENPARIDSLFVSSALVNESDRLFVLGGEEPLDRQIAVDPLAANLLQSSLLGDFDYVVMDLPRSLAIQQPEVLAGAQEIVLVTDLSMPALRDSIRLLALIGEVAPGARLQIVANRLGLHPKGDLRQKDFESGLGRKIDHLVPEDGKSVTAALNAGLPLAKAGAGGKMIDALKHIAEGFVPDDAMPVKQPLWRRLFS